MDKKVSVVIPAYNEEKKIPKVLECLKGQDCEVIVVDDGSTDRTVEIANSYGCKVIISGKKNVPYSRNLGIEHAKGNIIVSLDASEMIVPPNFIEEIKKNFEDCDGLIVREVCTKKTLVNRIAWLRSFYKYENAGQAIKVFRKDKNIRYDEGINSFAEDFTIRDTIKRKKYCDSTYIESDIYPTWGMVFKSWKGYGSRSHFMVAPLFFWLTSPVFMLQRLIKFKKPEALLIPVYDTIRTIGYIVGLFSRIKKKIREAV